MKRTVISLLLAAALLLLGAACSHDPAEPTRPPAPPERSPGASPVPSFPAAAEGEELMATVQTREDAEAIAELYGIELVEWSGHIAVYHTEEDPQDVIRRGQENGWPLLEVNQVITLD